MSHLKLKLYLPDEQHQKFKLKTTNSSRKEHYEIHRIVPCFCASTSSKETT
jgi:hypothetical protein